MDGEDNGNSIEVEEFPDPEGTMRPLRRFKSFAPGYFETMGNRLVAGRSITWSEIHEQRPVIVISEPLAREYWGEPSKAIGKRVRGSANRAVARDRRRRRRRARRWAESAADRDCVLADAE